MIALGLAWLLVGLVWLAVLPSYPPSYAHHYNAWAIATVILWPLSMGMEIWDWVKHSKRKSPTPEAK